MSARDNNAADGGNAGMVCNHHGGTMSIFAETVKRIRAPDITWKIRFRPVCPAASTPNNHVCSMSRS
jgi:hypothetical protein